MYNSLKNMPSSISQLIRFARGSHIVSFTFFAPPFFAVFFKRYAQC